MSFDHITTLVSLAFGAVGILGGSIGFLYGIRKDRKANGIFKAGTIEALHEDLVEIMGRGMGGTYIPGMSEEAGNQLKARVLDTLQRHLSPETYDWKTHRLLLKSKEQSRL
jgi:hypothetical protein